MSKRRYVAANIWHRLVWLVPLWVAFSLVVPARSAGAAGNGSASIDAVPRSGTDHPSVSGMTPSAVAASTGKPTSAARVTAVGSMPPLRRADSSHGVEHDAMPDMGVSSQPAAPPDHAHEHHAALVVPGSMGGMHTGPMQGGGAPADARSSDYSDGLHYGAMESMEMHDNAPMSMLLLDQLETFHGKDGNGQAWKAQDWYGNDADKLWIRTEGERSRGKLDNAELEVLWNRSVATFWSSQLGARHEWGRGPDRNWIAFGFQGLAPYWFELEATAYVGPSGRIAARLHAEYELLFTQRLVLQPELEVNVYGQSDPARRIGSGISDAQLGLRLRYEIRREFAPYIGVVLTRRYGATASYARRDGHPRQDRQFVVGMRIWF